RRGDFGYVGAPTRLHVYGVVFVEEQAGAADCGCVRRRRRHANSSRTVGEQKVSVVAAGEIDRDAERGARFVDEVLNYEFARILGYEEGLFDAIAVGDYRTKLVIDGIEHREIKVVVVVVERQDEGDVGSRCNRVRPLHVEAGLRIPAASIASAIRVARGVVDVEVGEKVQRRKTVDGRKSISVGRNGIGAEGIDDDHGLASTIEAACV